MGIEVKAMGTYSDEDPLALDVNVSNGELVRERHFRSEVVLSK